ncbi:MAG: ComEC/Rec2 family competence protein [bacterium]|nr:ComEC/Rec2 family competence protein [bacterium]
MANFFAWGAVFDLNREGNLKLVFFDVGQGDSAFIETPKGHQILIDGGPSPVVLEKLANEMPFWDRSIDLIILSHPEEDHMAGLIEVLKRYKVKNILWTGVVRDTPEFKEWQRLIGLEGAGIKIAKAGQKIFLGNVLVEVLHPFEDWKGKKLKDSNFTSVAVRLVFGENSFLFPGDAYSFQEKEMVLRQEVLDSDVLKAGHHGSKTSSSEEFLEKVSPSFVVISSGRDNSYGHPHPEVLARFEKYGINVLRTDQEGDIKIISNGKNYGLPNF